LYKGPSWETKLLQEIKDCFIGHLMKKMVKQMVWKCAICKQAKMERVAYLRLLQPLLVPSGVLSDITTDFVEGFSKSWYKYHIGYCV
jgi:hypothetical protein